MNTSIALQDYTLEREGCLLHYWLGGASDKPLVILTHGATVDHRMFEAQYALLLGSYRVLTWDMRGHGQSRPMGEAFTVERAVADLVAILEHIGAGTEQVILVGQSTGGYVAQEFVFRYPERVSALVMADCICITLPISWVDSLTLKSTPLLLRLYPYSLLLKQSVEGSAITPAARAYLYEAMSAIPKADYVKIWTGIANCLHAEPNYQITQPLLLIRGEQDALGNIAKDASRWVARDPHAEYVIIPNAGHMSNMDNPTAFNEAMLEFLARVTA